ncbi:hypothetical protein BCR34DRAFT_586489 [Clohesyomyces aquaticus]|uniref:Uncharacterized protein n=1 Tax=Clohesyomyces aquaticus TaxID=1231657 RepID=A0A1Y1ZTE2_9PLEO|nr:hypothetical protein BCR34DRAFT_586489 [Clohesyomyces aquaticus]
MTKGVPEMFPKFNVCLFPFERYNHLAVRPTRGVPCGWRWRLMHGNHVSRATAPFTIDAKPHFRPLINSASVAVSADYCTRFYLHRCSRGIVDAGSVSRGHRSHRCCAGLAEIVVVLKSNAVVIAPAVIHSSGAQANKQTTTRPASTTIRTSILVNFRCGGHLLQSRTVHIRATRSSSVVGAYFQHGRLSNRCSKWGNQVLDHDDGMPFVARGISPARWRRRLDPEGHGSWDHKIQANAI